MKKPFRTIPVSSYALNFLQPPEYSYKRGPIEIGKIVIQISEMKKSLAAQFWWNGEIKFKVNKNSRISIGKFNVSSKDFVFQDFFFTSSDGLGSARSLESLEVLVEYLEFPLLNVQEIEGGNFKFEDFEILCMRVIQSPKDENSISHICRIRKIDKVNFKSNDVNAHRFIDVFCTAISFLNAAPVFSPFILGYISKKLNYKRFTSVRKNRNKRKHNFASKFMERSEILIQELIDGMLDNTKNGVYPEIHILVDFYINAMNGDLVSAAQLIIFQSAIEKIVNEWQDLNIHTYPKVQGGIGTNLGIMLNAIGEGVDFPKQLPELSMLGNRENKNAPETVAYVRNKYAHKMPPHITWRHEVQAKRLAQRYLEILILYILQCKQPVVNTLIMGGPEGITEKLPWM